jgi:hypothetical protein
VSDNENAGALVPRDTGVGVSESWWATRLSIPAPRVNESDTPGAVSLARSVRRGLKEAGIALQAFTPAKSGPDSSLDDQRRVALDLVR